MTLKEFWKKEERDRNLDLKEKYLKQLDHQIKLVKSPSKEDKDQIHKIRFDIDALFKLINSELDEASQKARDFHYFTEVRNLFDSFKIYEVWKNGEGNMELSNAPCQCNTCVENLHHFQWCNRVMRQRKEEMKEYTCPGCQKLN